MVTRKEYLPGVPCWVDVTPPDVDAAARFYGHVFGWTFEDRTPAGAAGRYLVAQLDGNDVAGIGTPIGGRRPGAAQASAGDASPEAEPQVPGGGGGAVEAGAGDGSPTGVGLQVPGGGIVVRAAWVTSVAVEDADAAVGAVRRAGGSALVGPIDVPGAGRAAVCADPAGAVFKVWESAGHSGAQLVNGPNTWNWSDLTTPDPDGAEAFYGAVFGWEARSAGFGTMWCRPGYGDFLARLDPELRRRHAEPGVPEGFSDAVGWLAAAADTGDPPPATWGVTFAVDDTDGAVERAIEAGGRAVVLPYDAGPARIAVLEDPDGATFTVSHYQPG